VMVSILAGVGRPHKEIATLVINPRTGRAIDDVTLRLRFPDESHRLGPCYSQSKLRNCVVTHCNY
jgi:hypothetical protein